MADGRGAMQRQTEDAHLPEHRCPAFAFNMCCALKPRADGIAAVDPDVAIPARRSIWRARETIDGVPIICQGWAASAITMNDGRRQILTFLLPGDLVSVSLVFNSVSQKSLEAVTDVRYRLFTRTGIVAEMNRNPTFAATLYELWAEENSRADQLIVDLGRRSADERIASLILNLAERLQRRGLMHNGTIEFPLRQHHIADAAGLTTVHAGKVVAEFRRAGLIELSDRTLTLSQPDELRRVAGLH